MTPDIEKLANSCRVKYCLKFLIDLTIFSTRLEMKNIGLCFEQFFKLLDATNEHNLHVNALMRTCYMFTF